MPKLLITRPAADAAPLIRRLSEMGIESIAAPLLEIDYLDGPALEVDAVQAFLLTSANGVRALASRTERRDTPCLAVGDATARTARDLGFKQVESANGDVDDLARLVADRCEPKGGVLLHAAGSVSAGDLAAMLEPKGYKVWREMLYEAKTADTLPADAGQALNDGSVDGVVLYSPRTARQFRALVSSAGLDGALPGLTLFALSGNVRDAAGDGWREVIVAAHPDQESLLEAVRTCYG
ncbi:MAG: uroporphyrinogen-III synthase [Rhodospirillales bacterium]|nr:uroporphyrinogen-III synthase [Rhodospirillales bacterium]MBO6787766.1 uroporphyrinogen-III synthase [Rhodospirillales bacterium]